MERRLEKHLRKCKLTVKSYNKLISKINAMLPTCETRDDFMVKFANKCYRKEPDRKLAMKQAKGFLESLYGNIDILISKGPEVAIEIHLKSRVKKTIQVEEISYQSSSTTSHLLDPEDEKSIENHPMWTKRLKHYLLGPTLGMGGTSRVKLAWDENTKKKLAMKILFPKFAKTAKKEIKILRELHHKNIVKVYDCFDHVIWDNNETSVFAIEYAEHGVLIEYLMYTSKFEGRLARWFFTSLTQAVKYCHQRNIVHRDLKHDNCLLGKNFVLKITDFGFATHYYDEEMMKTQIGTAQYAAPEILMKEKYTNKVDIFSMGVMLFMALTGSQPWRMADYKTDRWFHMVQAGKWKEFFQYHGKRSNHVFKEDQKNILMGLLEPDPDERWTIHDIEKCIWYNRSSYDQREVAARLQERKRAVDEKRRTAMKLGGEKVRKSVSIFSLKLPYVYFQPPPPLSFVILENPAWVLEYILNAIDDMKGSIEYLDKKKFKCTFHVNKMVDIGMLHKQTKKKQFYKIRVPASVQIWTLPGQQKAIAQRTKMLAAISEGENKFSDEQKDSIKKSSPQIKCIVVFRSEGHSEAKFYFPSIYSDILLRLPAEIICKDVIYDDHIKEE